MTFRSTKTYGHEVGLSASFRQWRAPSHCSKIHGYALAVTLIFESDDLDYRNWVVDFGGLSEVREWLKCQFDHKMLVAQDDPHLNDLLNLHNKGIADVIVIPAVGCEMFAKHIYDFVSGWLTTVHQDRVKLVSVEVREHGANSALYVG